MVVTFRLSFFDKWKHKWKEFEIECPDLEPNSSVEEKAECVANELAEAWRNSFQIANEYVIRRYRDKMYDLISKFLETESRRKTLVIKVSGDTEEAKKLSVYLSKLALAKVSKGKGDRILGLSTKQYVFLETDSRTKKCFQEMIKIAYTITNIIHEKVSCHKIYAYITRHGFHYIIPCRIRKDFCCDIYSYIRMKYENNDCIDMRHVILSIKRGYTTLSIKPTRKNDLLVDFDREHGIATVFTTNEQLFDWVSEVFSSLGYETIMIGANGGW